MASWFETHGVAVLLTMRVSEEHRKSDASRRMKPLTWETRSIADPRQDGAEGDAGSCSAVPSRSSRWPSSLPFISSLQRQRDPVGSEQRLERRIFVVALGRDLDLDRAALVVVMADEGKGGVAAAKLAAGRVDRSRRSRLSRCHERSETQACRGLPAIARPQELQNRCVAP